MTRILTTLSCVIASVACSYAAMAATPHEVNGKIERINAKVHSITVNHRAYRYDAKTALPAFKVGEAVRFEWKKVDHHRMIEKLLPPAV